MAYQLHLHLHNDTSEELTLIEKTCWAGAGTAWTEQGQPGSTIHTLSMNGSGTSGMLRFRTGGGALFAVAVGVHNYKRWCDVQGDLADDAVLTRLHGAYYTEGDPKNAALWAQSAEAGVQLAGGRQVKVAFYLAEGNRLVGTIAYF